MRNAQDCHEPKISLTHAGAAWGARVGPAAAPSSAAARGTAASLRELIKRLSLIDDVNREELERCVSDDRKARMLHVAQVQHRSAGGERDRLFAGVLHSGTLHNVRRFHAVVGMQ